MSFIAGGATPMPSGHSEVTVTCDRCHREVEGLRGEYATAGFYDTTGHTWWSRYARPGESIVCDDCMFADPAYRADYGIHYTHNKPDPVITDVERAEREQRESALIREELEAARRIDREIYGQDIQTT